jgi:ABC-2 type transport system permease protein
MYGLLFKTFLRSRSTIIGIAFILLAGISSLFIGRHFLEKQETAIQQSAKFQEEFIGNYTKWVSDDLGLLMYYLRFSLANKPHPLAGLSIGQKDINPSVQSVTIRNLENQKWDTDLINPTNLLLGNMDLGFVMIYLVPLLIVAFTYNIYAEEKESGTWSLLRLHAASTKRFLRQKLVVRMVTVYAVVFLLLVAAVIILRLPVNVPFLITMLLLMFYVCFWFAVSFWVVTWKKTSAFNAVSLLALWVFLTILSPALVNSYMTNAYPVPEALEMVVKQRQGYHEKWDMDKKVTMDKFYAHYPQYRKYALPDKQFSWLWYYAMHQMGDDESATESQALNEKLWRRHEVSSNIALFLPTLHTQLSLNSLAQSDLENHLLFLDSTKRFHEKTRLFFYDKIFEEHPVSSIDWKGKKMEYFSTPQANSTVKMLLPLVLFTVVFFGLASRNLKSLHKESK